MISPRLSRGMDYIFILILFNKALACSLYGVLKLIKVPSVFPYGFKNHLGFTDTAKFSSEITF